MSIPGTIQFPGLSTTPSPPPSGSYVLYTKTNNTLNLEDSFGNVYTFGATNAITALTGDVSAMGPGSAAATVNFVGGESAANVATATAAYLNATSVNIPNTLVLRDSSGNFAASTITANLTGTATNATNAVTAVNFSGSLLGDVTGTQSATVVSLVGGQTAASVASATVAANAATSLNTASTIVERDASGNFAASTITANLTGTATNATNAVTAVNFSGSLSGDVTGTQSSTSISSTTVTGKLLTGYTVGTNTPISATDSILSAFEKVQGQINSTEGSAITSLTNDVTATGPGAAAATVVAIQGYSVSTNVPSDAQILIYNNSTSKYTPESITGDITLTNAGATTVISIQGSSVSSTAPTDAQLLIYNNSTSKYVPHSISGDVVVADTGIATIQPNVVTNSKLAQMTANTVKANITGGLANPTDAALGTVTETTSSVLTLTGWTDATIGSPTITVKQSSTSQSGYLSSTDWNTFNNKQPAGNYITALTGDVAATGPGSASSTIQSNVVSNSKLAQAPTDTLKGNNTGVTANVTDLTVSQVNTMLGTVTTIGTYDSQTSQANGLDIVGNTLYAQSATTSNPGMVNATTQSFAGNKTFTGTVAIAPASTSALVIDTTSFIFDSTNMALGIGLQPSTSSAIDIVNSSGSSKPIQQTSYGTGSTNVYRGRFARGTSSSPTAAQSGDTLAVFSGRGYGTSQFATASTGVINVVAGETFTNASNLTYLQFETTPTGSVTLAESMRVASTGVTLGPQTSSTAIHQVNGGYSGTTRTITSSTFTIDTTTTDYIIYTDSTSNTITVTLPAPTNGRTLVIEDKVAKAGTNAITILPHASETINGVSSFTINQNYGSVRITSDGTNWFITSSVPNVASTVLPPIALTESTGAATINWSLSNMYTLTLNANLTVTFSNATAGQTIIVRLTNTASNYTVTWPTVRWPAATAPTMTTGAVSDVYTFIYDGSNYYGSYVQNMS